MNQMRLMVLSNVIHYRHQGQLHAYGAYAREIDIWADLFAEVIVAAPCRNERPAGFAVPFTRSNVSIVPQPELGGHTVRAKARLLAGLPMLTVRLARAILEGDAVLVRCPGSFGLIGAALAPLLNRYRVAKYAGQWNGFPGEPFSVRLQRSLLRSRWWGAPVTVYGTWPGQPDHVVPFFTSVMTDMQVARGRRAALAKEFRAPLRVLFTGRLSAAKNVDVLLEALARLRARGMVMEAKIVGEGPERPRLERLACELGLSDLVCFTGGVEFERVLDFYETSDVLVLASETEGWPKAITEAMTFGLVCIGPERGTVPEILGKGRGFVVPPRDVNALETVLAELAAAPERLAALSARAAEWAQQYSLDGLREALRELLASRWKIKLRPGPAAFGPGALSS